MRAALDTTAAAAAAQRLAETLAAGTRFTESTLYRLTGIDIAAGKIGGTLGLSRFTSYALTLDLLEGELNDALAAGVPTVPGSLPLRDRYLPDVASVLDVSGRLCAGGALALCAFARPATFYRDRADYVLLVQERSGNVINAARRLAVIPKGFHQPMTDYRSDAQDRGYASAGDGRGAVRPGRDRQHRERRRAPPTRCIRRACRSRCAGSSWRTPPRCGSSAPGSA